MQKIPCSVPILTLNSAENLAECLESVRDFEDVYLVDGNSTDGTQEIARTFGRPVYTQVETDEPNVRIKDFTAVRKRAYGFAKTNWLLDLDSDECMTPELVEEIRKVVHEDADVKTAYRIQHKLRFGERKTEYAFFYPTYVLRLYHVKSGIKLPDGKALHESVEIPDDVVQKELTNIIWSRGPETYAASVKKDDRYLAIVKEKMFSSDQSRTFAGVRHCIHSACVNFLRSGYILFKSLYLSLRYGFRRSLPFVQVIRNARYNFLISLYRLRQIVYIFFVRNK